MARLNSPELALYEQGVLARLADVEVGYDGTPVLDGVTLDLQRGQVVFVTGPTSAGKTTLTHLLRLALPPRQGEVVILGSNVARLSGRARAKLKRRIGYVAENPVFVEEWTGVENITLSLRLAGRRSRDFADDVRELTEFVGLGIAAEEQVGRLSGAARRKVAIARALAAKPEILLADDPTAGMSPDAGRRIVRLLGEMRRVGAAVVIATQDETLVDCIAGATHYRIERGHLRRVSEDAEVEAEAYR